MTRLILAVSGGQKLQADRVTLASLRGLVGPGLLVAVGYMDPGNWATDIAGGAGFAYGLLPVVLLASLLAVGFQLLVARLTLATGEDLATLTRRHLPKPLATASWLAGEAAILATALAELVGGAAALRLLFGLPIAYGVGVTALGTVAVLSLAKLRQGGHEALIHALVGLVALSFLLLLFQVSPDPRQVVSGMGQVGSALGDASGLMIALGILGATLMPHNLYLHAGELAKRARAIPAAQRAVAYRFARNDTVISLILAMAVNAAILIVAATSLSGSEGVSSLDGAYAAMRDHLGFGAALIFALALYAAGQSSAITGVMAGQVLSQGFERAHASNQQRSVLTRFAAVALAIALITLRGSDSPDGLLVWSQVVLGVALPFALVPLVLLVSRRDIAGQFALGPQGKLLAGGATTVIIGLNLYLIYASLAA
ncbi:Nramp family divalent metal transporter [Chitinimonas sp.]|uniref:Nramp family divalent metal transporter n=1 Tax=Chitinimonas sp. TaxID=1934313 RepID=UPI002F945549